MSVCPTVLVLRSYGCCHPCLYMTPPEHVKMSLPEKEITRLSRLRDLLVQN